MVPHKPVAVFYESEALLELNVWPGGQTVESQVIDVVDVLPALRRGSNTDLLLGQESGDPRFFVDYFLRWEPQLTGDNDPEIVIYILSLDIQGTSGRPIIITPAVGRGATIQYADAGLSEELVQSGTYRFRGRNLRVDVVSRNNTNPPSVFFFGAYLRVI